MQPLLYKFTVGRYGCSVCGGLPGGRHEPDCAATEELRAAIAEEREACAKIGDERMLAWRVVAAMANDRPQPEITPREAVELREHEAQDIAAAIRTRA